MDEALACHTGGQGLNPDKTKEVFSVWKKIKYVVLSPCVPHHVLSLSFSLLMPHSNMNQELTYYGETKERVAWKNPAPSAEANTEVNAMYGKGVKTTLMDAIYILQQQPEQ